MNGAEYLASLRDDRAVFIYGERVKDVTTHPAFRNTARMIARAAVPPALRQRAADHAGGGANCVTRELRRIPAGPTVA